MIQIKDENGSLVKGLLRSPTGAIVVHDPSALAKYKAEQSLASRVSKTEQKVEEIHSMLKEMMKSLGK